MPKLNQKDLGLLKAQPTKDCLLCKQTLHCDYCEDCDLYFDEGHKSECAFMHLPQLATDDHRRHYTSLRDPVVRDVDDDGLIKIFTPDQILHSPRFKFWE